MAESILEICNSALMQLGHSPIISLDNPQGETGVALGKPTKIVLCNHFYPKVRDAVLRAHPWSCATARQQLALEATGPISGFTYYFTLPSDPYCLRVLDIDDTEAPWRVEGRKLACDNNSVIARFIKRVEDTSEYDALLDEAIAARMASTLAYPVAGSMSLAGEMWNLYEAKLREARTMNGMEGTQEALYDNTLTDVRL
jgi:hypothetical protein